MLEGRARRLACLLWEASLCSISPAQSSPPHPTLPPNHHRHSKQLPATLAPTWQTHTPVSMPTCSAAPMTTSGHASKLPKNDTQSFQTLHVGLLVCPALCPLSVPGQTADGQATWSQVCCPKDRFILPTSQLPCTESSRLSTQSQLFLTSPQDRWWQNLPSLWHRACLPTSPDGARVEHGGTAVPWKDLET